ncbi:flagellar protein FlaG [Sporosarcina sp. BI001-red]|uniref:flagellar protein FlaG n=1 Tax=Sporosarcina sp. BI001-red TaxID=2282866 RepID=UPI000E259818|nr:flagellar protein FlaG [Sporosarcina sp. BI001-red]REB11166.1 flagellar protein FlaG [Sporosarcina sp. BI001-red]
MVSQIGGGPDRQIAAGPVDGTTSEIVTKVEAIQDQAQQQASRERDLPVKQAKELTAGMNKFLESVDTQLRFKMHDELHEYYVTIVDSKTDEVIREIPSKKLLDMHAEMRKFVGLLIDRKI